MTPSNKLWLATCCADPKQPNRLPESLLLGVEAFAAQGFPTDIIDRGNKAPMPQLQDLAGNVMSYPVCLALLMALFLNIEYDKLPASTKPGRPMADLGPLMHNVGLYDD